MVRAGLVGLLAVAALSGCGGDAATDRTLDPALAKRLAAMSETVADQLEAGDGCRARAQLVRLRKRAAAEIRAGNVPDELVRGLRAALETLDASVTCETQTATEPATTAEVPDEETDEHNRRDKKHEDKGKGNDKKKHDDNGQGADDEPIPTETGASEDDG